MQYQKRQGARRVSLKLTPDALAVIERRGEYWGHNVSRLVSLMLVRYDAICEAEITEAQMSNLGLQEYTARNFRRQLKMTIDGDARDSLEGLEQAIDEALGYAKLPPSELRNRKALRIALLDAAEMELGADYAARSAVPVSTFPPEPEPKPRPQAEPAPPAPKAKPKARAKAEPAPAPKPKAKSKAEPDPEPDPAPKPKKRLGRPPKPKPPKEPKPPKLPVRKYPKATTLHGALVARSRLLRSLDPTMVELPPVPPAPPAPERVARLVERLAERAGEAA